MKSKKSKIIVIAISIAVISVVSWFIYYKYSSTRENEIKELIKLNYEKKLSEKIDEAYGGERAIEYGLNDLEYYVNDVYKDKSAYAVKVILRCNANKIDPNYKMEDTERELLAFELIDWAEDYVSIEDTKYGTIRAGSDSQEFKCFVNDKLSYSLNMLYEYDSPSTHTCEVCGNDASHSLEGLGGNTEWYCDTHWKEMKSMFENMIDG